MFQRFVPTLLLTAVAILIVAQQPLVAQETSLPQPALGLPLSSPSVSTYGLVPQPLSIVQERAKFEADQRMLRIEWNKWIGYSPARPNTNASYLANGRQLYYIPTRGYLISAGINRSWYW